MNEIVFGLILIAGFLAAIYGLVLTEEKTGRGKSLTLIGVLAMAVSGAFLHQWLMVGAIALIVLALLVLHNWKPSKV